ncbi:hypothetical protein F7725_023297 [Dissostichus mawsoni]|uniref:RNA ligase 1 n=1 Tax=Dissostichus mawsoni TaxID=36200 RepID=A0A7J5Z0A3_DISMA|nr:hypothetical protein F7725_023297 [Dissostichus mawsoni]
MRSLGSVQHKIPCVFLTEVKEEPSRKRDCQQFQVVATETLNPVALEADIHSAVATEKIDGTCCYVTLYNGRPHLWARLDRKPNKQAEKRFKKHQHQHRSCKGFSWDVEEDFKIVPEAWIPAHEPGGDEDEDEDEEELEVSAVPLADLMERTLELIGTNVNGNPYGLGSKKQPLHCLVSHGSFGVRNPPPVDFHQISSWLREGPGGRVEGLVHRHHLGLRWPDGGASLGERPVVVRVVGGENTDRKDLFSSFCRLNGQRFSRLQDVLFDS